MRLRRGEVRRARRPHSARRVRDEAGAIAIMVGLLATALFAVASLSVDLGSAWARKRAVQKQVDISALSVGWMLPMRASNKMAIAHEVSDYFTEQANQVEGQTTATAQELINGRLPDGEIIFQHSDFSPCSDDCPQMRVIAPPSRVEFGLASAIGVDHTMVQREATVRITSELPPTDKAIPFWLPTGCGYGPTEADTTQGGLGGQPLPTEFPTALPTALPTATPTAAPTGSPYSPTPVGEHQIQGLEVTTIVFLGNLTVTGYSITGVGAQYKKVTLRAYAPTGSAFVDFAAETNGNGVVPAFAISQEISGTPGDWRVYAMAQKNNSMEFSANHLTIRVEEPIGPVPTTTPTPAGEDLSVGCVGQDRGNFGQLDSPRREGGTKQERLARNLAKGLDHELLPYVFPDGSPEQKDCGAGGSVIAGGQFDDVSRVGNNCITGDTGNDGPKMMEGLITGVAGFAPGRLAVSNGATTCPGRSDVSLSGVLINNDVLSCFLRDGATLSDIAQTSGAKSTMLDPAILSSPRFVWLPVVYATDRAQKDFQPIRQFVPGFITDETQTTVATLTNGLEINGNSISVLNIFTFNRDALPTQEQSNTAEYSPELGGGIVRLVG